MGPLYAATKDLNGNPLPRPTFEIPQNVPKPTTKPIELDWDTQEAAWNSIRPDFEAAKTNAADAIAEDSAKVTRNPKNHPWDAKQENGTPDTHLDAATGTAEPLASVSKKTAR